MKAQEILKLIAAAPLTNLINSIPYKELAMFKQQKQHKQADINYPIIFDRIFPRYAFNGKKPLAYFIHQATKGFYYDSRHAMGPLMSAAPR